MLFNGYLSERSRERQEIGKELYSDSGYTGACHMVHNLVLPLLRQRNQTPTRGHRGAIHLLALERACEIQNEHVSNFNDQLVSILHPDALRSSALRHFGAQGSRA